LRKARLKISHVRPPIAAAAAACRLPRDTRLEGGGGTSRGRLSPDMGVNGNAYNGEVRGSTGGEVLYSWR